MITQESIEDAINIMDLYEGTEEESLSDEAVVSAMVDDYNLDIRDAHAALYEASLIWETRKSES